MRASFDANESIPIREFIVRCVEQAGGAVEERAPGLLDALLPPPLNGDGDAESLRTLALDTDALGVESGAELATVGSPFLESLIEFTASRGTAAVGHLRVEGLRKNGLREEAQRALLFSKCRVRYPSVDPDVLLCWHAVFHFKVTFVSDEKRERLFVVPVNLWSNQFAPGLAERLPELTIVSAPPTPYRSASRGRVEAAYETARRALNRMATREAAQYQARIGKRFAVEFHRMSDYYEQIARDLRRRRERETDESRVESLDQRLEATAREREHKLRELGEKYHLRIRAELTSAKLISQPKTFFKVLVDRKDKTRELTLAYDSLLDRLESPVCEACGDATTRVQVAEPCRFLCPSCAAQA